MGASEVAQFLTHLANARQVSVSTQNQALSAILFLYRDVLHIDLPWVSQFSRSKVPKQLPVVLTQHEVKSLLIAAQKSAPNPYGLMLQLLYGTGMRLGSGVGNMYLQPPNTRPTHVAVLCAATMLKKGRCSGIANLLLKQLV